MADKRSAHPGPGETPPVESPNDSDRRAESPWRCSDEIVERSVEELAGCEKNPLAQAV